MAAKLTLKDVAIAAGVSEMTASRALRGVHDVSSQTRQRVTAAARAIGYVPNRIAGALASRSVDLVGVIVPSFGNFVFPEVLSGVSSVLKNSGLQAVFGVTDYDLKTEEMAIGEMLSWRPRGLILAGLEHTETSVKMLTSAGIPIVEIMDTDGAAIDFCVGISHIGAGRDMAAEIVRRGYRKIGFIGSGMPLDRRAQKRFSGFLAGLEQAGCGLRDREFYDGASSIAKGRELTAEMLARSPDIACIYYSSDVMSAGGLMHCLTNGISVPDGLALAGFNGLDLLNGLPLQLATADASRFDIGARAAAIVVGAGNHATMPKITEFDAKIDTAETL